MIIKMLCYFIFCDNCQTINAKLKKKNKEANNNLLPFKASVSDILFKIREIYILEIYLINKIMSSLGLNF